MGLSAAFPVSLRIVFFLLLHFCEASEWRRLPLYAHANKTVFLAVSSFFPFSSFPRCLFKKSSRFASAPQKDVRGKHQCNSSSTIHLEPELVVDSVFVIGIK